MRGTRLLDGVAEARRRIIPAHAGNSRYVNVTGDTMTDHPRACGELTAQAWMTVDGNGSSPRMRGTLHPHPELPAGLRIIPAHAGNSHSRLGACCLLPDHPRACGELTRSRTRSRPSRRIIPAHAGNSCFRRNRSRRPPDHPRACGELRVDGFSNDSQYGSSPRMRGTLFPRTTTNTGLLAIYFIQVTPTCCGRQITAFWRI